MKKKNVCQLYALRFFPNRPGEEGLSQLSHIHGKANSVSIFQYIIQWERTAGKSKAVAFEFKIWWPVVLAAAAVAAAAAASAAFHGLARRSFRSQLPSGP